MRPMIVIKDMLRWDYFKPAVTLENAYLSATKMLINVRMMLKADIAFALTLMLIFSGRSSSTVGSCPIGVVSPGELDGPKPP
jgi:hypothetical protein